MTTIIDKYANAIPVWIVDAEGNPVGTATVSSANDRDTDGNPVPTYKAHSYTYDTSGNLITDTVTNGSSTWVRTLMYANGVQTTDSGWVKQ